MKNKPKWVYDKMRAHYGKPQWWPGHPYEIMVGAVLVQNTAWGNVEQSLSNFGERLTPGFVERIPDEELVRLIYSSGFYTAKAACLKALTAWYKQYGYSVEAVRAQPQDRIRRELLSVRGIGQETADAMMLYAFRFPTFVIDAYIRRLAERLALPVTTDYRTLQAYFSSGLTVDVDLFGNYHSLILEHGKKHCRKKPQCTGCPFEQDCSFPK